MLSRSNEHNFSDVYGSVNYDWAASKVYMTPFGIQSLCLRPNIVYTSINIRESTALVVDKHWLITTFLVYVLKSPIVNHLNVNVIYSPITNIGSREVYDVKINHGSVQSDWTSAIS